MTKRFRSRVTTGIGDVGKTRLLDGSTVSKADPAIEAVGRLDALRAQIALFRLELAADASANHQELQDFLHWLLIVLFALGAELSDPRNQKPEYKPVMVGPAHLARVEGLQAKLEAGLKLPRAFILSASTILAAKADILATEARHFERAVVRLAENVPEFNTISILPLLNRLSDLFFIMGRHLEHGQHEAVDYSTLEDEDSS